MKNQPLEQNTSKKKQTVLLSTIWMFPKIGGKHPNWMVYFMENTIKMDDLGGPPLFSETPICFFGVTFWSKKCSRKIC